MGQHSDSEKLRALLLLGALSGNDADGTVDNTGVWNLLVQILLPLVLVLMFVLLIVFEALSVDIDKYVKEVRRRYNEEEVLREITITKIEMQWLILNRNLALVDIDTRQRLGLTFYPLDNPVQNIRWVQSDGQSMRPGIQDPVFAKFCQATYRIFASDEILSVIKVNMFEVVVKRSELEPIDTSLIKWGSLGVALSKEELNSFAVDLSIEELEEAVDTDQLMTFESYLLDPLNAKRLAVEVNRAINEIGDDIRTVQEIVLERLIDLELEYLQSTRTLSEEEREFYARIMDPNTPPDARKRTIEAWWRFIYDRLRDQCFGNESSATHPFLPVPD